MGTNLIIKQVVNRGRTMMESIVKMVKGRRIFMGEIITKHIYLNTQDQQEFKFTLMSIPQHRNNQSVCITRQSLPIHHPSILIIPNQHNNLECHHNLRSSWILHNSQWGNLPSNMSKVLWEIIWMILGIIHSITIMVNLIQRIWTLSTRQMHVF